MSETLNLGTDGNWGVKKDSLLGYNSENGNFKPLAFNFDRASSATVVNQSGLIETVGSGEPRIDFLGNTKGALLLEPSRSNAITYSEDFSQSVWNKTGLTVSSNQIISPDGSLNADEINITGVNAHYLFDVISVNASTNYVLTFYAKKGTATDVSYSIYDNSNSADIIASTSYYSQISNTNWTRITVEFTTPSGCTSVRPYPLRDGSSAGTVYIWGAQLEQGSYATSYIPTSGQSGGVTRVGDVCNNGANAQVINSTEGVLYFEGSVFTADGTFRRIGIGTSDNGFANSIQLRYNTIDNSITYQFRAGNVYQADLTITTNTTIVNKIACVWKINRFEIWVNGVKEAQDTSGSVPTLNTFDSLFFGKVSASLTEPFKGNVKDLRVYNTALTSAELQALTTI